MISSNQVGLIVTTEQDMLCQKFDPTLHTVIKKVDLKLNTCGSYDYCLEVVVGDLL